MVELESNFFFMKEYLENNKRRLINKRTLEYVGEGYDKLSELEQNSVQDDLSHLSRNLCDMANPLRQAHENCFRCLFYMETEHVCSGASLNELESSKEVQKFFKKEHLDIAQSGKLRRGIGNPGSHSSGRNDEERKIRQQDIEDYLHFLHEVWAAIFRAKLGIPEIAAFDRSLVCMNAELEAVRNEFNDERQYISLDYNGICFTREFLKGIKRGTDLHDTAHKVLEDMKTYREEKYTSEYKGQSGLYFKIGRDNILFLREETGSYPLEDCAGAVYFQGISAIKLFLQRLFLIGNAGAPITWEYYYHCDPDQQDVVDVCQLSHFTVKDRFNMAVSGNAGSGKSFVGSLLLKEYIAKGAGLYLTLSTGLANCMYDEYNNEQGIQKQIQLVFYDRYFPKDQESRVDDIFSFLEEAADDYKYNDQQSAYQLFSTFWAAECRNIAWNKLHSVEEIAKDIAWKDIHGYIKGCIPDGDMGSCISYGKYKDKKKEINKELVEDNLDFIYNKVFKRYQRWLTVKKKKIYDDNDLAHKIIKDGIVSETVYSYVFIDECQDLTEVQLQALFSLLKNSTVFLLASDRCQNVYATQFRAGVMQSIFRKMHDASTSKEKILCHNYRCPKDIVAFQNFIIKKLGKVQSLKAEEKIPIQAVCSTGIKPILILNYDKNKDYLKHLWESVKDDVKLQIIFSEDEKKKAFGDAVAKTRHLESIAGCKGMEYPTVLLWNVLSDKIEADEAEAWRYFYAGATRSFKRLIVFEEKEITEFGDAVAAGLIEECEDLSAQYPGGNGISWGTYILQQLNDVSSESYIEQADAYKNRGDYARAIELYKACGVDCQMDILECQGLEAENNRDYRTALMNYLQCDSGNFIMRLRERYLSDLNDVEKMICELYLDSLDFSKLCKMQANGRWTHEMRFSEFLNELMEKSSTIKGKIEKCYSEAENDIEKAEENLCDTIEILQEMIA